MVDLKLPEKEETNSRMSIDDPPGNGTPQSMEITPPEMIRVEVTLRGSIHSSAKQIMESARSALNTAMENGATLKKANDWLALTQQSSSIPPPINWTQRIWQIWPTAYWM